MVLSVIRGDRIDLEARQGAINVFTLRLWRKDADGNRIAWDPSPKPTVTAHIRASFADAAPLITAIADEVLTPTADGETTLTVIFTLDLDATPLPEPASAPDNAPIVNIGWWDFRMEFSATDIDYPTWGAVTARRRVTRV